MVRTSGIHGVVRETGAMAEWLRCLTSVAFLLSSVIGLSQWHIPGSVGSNPTENRAGMRTLVKPLFIIII